MVFPAEVFKNRPGDIPQISQESSLPRNNACGGAAIWNESVNDGDDDAWQI